MHLKLRADAVLPVKECVKSWHATCFGYVCVCVYELTCRVLFDEGSERVEKVVRIPDGVSEDFCLTHVRFPSFFPRRSLQANIHWIYLCFFFCQLSCLCQEASICISQTTTTTKKTNPHKKTKTTLDLCSGLVWAVSLTGGVKCSTLKEGDTKHPQWLAVMSSEHQAACHQHRASHIRGHDPTAAHHFKMVLLQFQARFQVDLDQIRSDQVNLICLNNGSKQGHVNIV